MATRTSDVVLLSVVVLFSVAMAVWNPSHGTAQTVDLQSEVTAEVDGKDASLALLEFVMANRTGRSCGAKRSKLVVSNMNEEGGEVQTTDQRSIPESDVLELARTLPANENILFLYRCEVSGSTFFAKGISISHVAYDGESGWNANLMRVGNALDERPPAPASLDDDAVAYALQTASTQMNDILPKATSHGARLDSVAVEEKTLIYKLTLDAEASDVNARKFRRAVTKEVSPSLCKDERHLTMFRSGVRYEYRYRGKDGEAITAITVGASDCD
jgi:hypothetical protein